MAQSLFNAVKEYPWFFMGVSGFVGGLLVWVIYLRYRLSKLMLTNQVEIEKYRIEKQILDQNPVPHLLTGRSDADEIWGRFLQSGEHCGSIWSVSSSKRKTEEHEPEAVNRRQEPQATIDQGVYYLYLIIGLQILLVFGDSWG